MTDNTKSSSFDAFPLAAGSLYLQIFTELKKEVAQAIKDARDTERNTLLYCGAVAGFLVTRCGESGFKYLAWLPLVLALFGGYRVVVLMISITPRAQYLSKLECQALKDQPLSGWETFFRSHYRRGIGISMFVFWIFLIVATGLLPRLAPNFLCSKPLIGTNVSLR